MVRPVAPASCLLDDCICLYAPAASQIVYDLIIKITSVVFSIFTAMGEFIQTCFRGSEATAAPPLSTSQPTTPLSTNQSVIPLVPIQPVVPSPNRPGAITLVTKPFPDVSVDGSQRVSTGVQDGVRVLSDFANWLCTNEPISREFIDKNMQTPEKAQQFFARLIGYFCVMEKTTQKKCLLLVTNLEDLQLFRNISDYLEELEVNWSRICSFSISGRILKNLFLENWPKDQQSHDGEYWGSVLDTRVNQLINSSPLFKQCVEILRNKYLSTQATQSTTEIFAPCAASSKNPEMLKQEHERNVGLCLEIFKGANQIFQRSPQNSDLLKNPDSARIFCARVIVNTLISQEPQPLIYLPPFTLETFSAAELPISTLLPRRCGSVAHYYDLTEILQRELANFSPEDQNTIKKRFADGYVDGFSADPKLSGSINLFLSEAFSLAEWISNKNESFRTAAESARFKLFATG